MVVGIVMGRKGSQGFPGKNTHKVCGKPMAEWVLESANEVCDEVYLTTDCHTLATIGSRHGAMLINRPPELCTNKALGEDVYIHAASQIQLHDGPDNFYVLMMANAPTFKWEHIEKGIDFLTTNRAYDSACTVSKYNMYGPPRMRTITDKQLCNYNLIDESTCDRDSSGNFYTYDCSVAVVRPYCLNPAKIKTSIPPQRWLGTQVYPITNNAGVDVDYEWQIGQVEWWLKNNGMV